MLFELTNKERKYVGLEPVETTWKKVLVTSPAKEEEKWLYFDGETIRKLITISSCRYREDQVEQQTADDGQTLLPKTAKGKSKKLTFSSLESLSGIGVYFEYAAWGVKIANYSTQTTFYGAKCAGDSFSVDGLRTWLDTWIAGTNQGDLAELASFRIAKRQHVKIHEGDFFAFKVGRREWGFGRILLDIPSLRKTDEFKKSKNYGLQNLMGPTLIVKVYHIIRNTPEIDIDELHSCSAFPSQPIMDNCFYYGEYKIIGHKPLQIDEQDMLISCRRSVWAGEMDIVYLQYGLIFRMEKSKLIHSRLEQLGVAEEERARILKECKYMKETNSFGLEILSDLDLMKKCVGERSNVRYWDSDLTNAGEDLRNPKLYELKKVIFTAFGLDADKNYAENLAFPAETNVYFPN